MADIAALNRLLEPEVESLGYRLVRVAFLGGKSDPTLQVMAEKPSTRQLDLSDCEVISRKLSETLDALEADGRDPIEGGYRLEVSSPGIDRPLTRLADFDDWKGHDARVNLADQQNGRKQFKGSVAGTEGADILLHLDNGEGVAIPFASIHSAKLLLTDKLINATAPLSTEGADTIQTVED
ncbi:ribosome maturation factor RimP [Sphingomonas daechungensis]|uniref:Ribosome maturation factor RimP n=1 Tax=Sphingomonas daechungensis TaxID=1176646 RepID=A0ABX6SXH9_9SPHN|nr:ribosome maturation protein RimP [Sphingomonas daechungensis]QNP42304.1 ribosome maturation protein RimP [Sphingomonas daechungensis]